MRILLAYPPHAWSTADVAHGYERALRRVPGVELYTWGLWERINFWHYTTRWWAGQIRKDKRRQGLRPPNNAYRLSKDEVLLKASHDILQEALWKDVEWVVAICGVALHPDSLLMLRRAGRKTAIVFTECPYDDERVASITGQCDLVFVNDRSSLRTIPGSIYLPTAFDAEIHRPEGYRPDSCDVLFVGTGFPERIRMMERTDWTGIDLQIRGYWPVRDSSPLKPHVIGHGMVVENRDAAAMYRTARIVLNTYRRHPTAESMNPRAYEVAACGGFGLHEDVRSEAREILGERGAGFFSRTKDLGSAVRAWLEAENLREVTAAHGYEVIQGNSYDNRVETLLTAMDRRQVWPASCVTATGWESGNQRLRLISQPPGAVPAGG